MTDVDIGLTIAASIISTLGLYKGIQMRLTKGEKRFDNLDQRLNRMERRLTAHLKNCFERENK